MRVKEFGGQGDQGSCSLHSFLTNLLLPNLNDSQRPEQSHRRACLDPFPTHTATNLSDLLRAHGICEGDRLHPPALLSSSHSGPLCCYRAGGTQ